MRVIVLAPLPLFFSSFRKTGAGDADSADVPLPRGRLSQDRDDRDRADAQRAARRNRGGRGRRTVAGLRLDMGRPSRGGDAAHYVALRALASRDEAATEFHLTVARRLLERTESLSPPQKDFVWRRYVAVPPQDQSLGGSGIQKPLDKYAEVRWRKPSPDRPTADIRDLQARALISAVSTSSGRARTKFASPACGSRRPSNATQLEGNWLTAATTLAEALKQDPSLHAAALHLGRIGCSRYSASKPPPCFDRRWPHSIIPLLISRPSSSAPSKSAKSGSARRRSSSRRGEACSLRAGGADGAG